MGAISGWLAARWAGAKLAGAAVQWSRLLPWMALALGLAAAIWAIDRHGYRRGEKHERPIAYAAGEKAERAAWLAAQALATKRHTELAKATERRQADVGTKVGDNYAHDTGDLHAAYQRVRDKARGGSASGADLSGVPGAAGGPHGAARADDIIVTAPLGLIEEGDVYRLQVISWQAWYAGVAAAAKAPE